jgi:DnaJ-class molecular chaperone
MKTFYDLLNIKLDDSSEIIKFAYKNKIKKYNDIEKLTSDDISQIKQLKTALFILSNDEYKYNYDQLINNNKIICIKDNENIPNENIPNENIPNANIPNANNYEDNEFTLNTLFSNNIDKQKIDNFENNKDNSFISNRIFSMSNIYNQKDINLNFMNPIHTRESRRK